MRRVRGVSDASIISSVVVVLVVVVVVLLSCNNNDHASCPRTRDLSGQWTERHPSKAPGRACYQNLTYKDNIKFPF